MGGNPFDTTSIYSLIHYLERKWANNIRNGRHGDTRWRTRHTDVRDCVTTRFDATVDKIVIGNGVAEGVLLSSGERLDADLVVSHAYPAFLYSKTIEILDRCFSRMKLKFAQSSMGLFVLYFGTTKRYEDVAYWTIRFGDRYRELLQDIFHNYHLGQDFSLYVHRPTATDFVVCTTRLRLLYVLAPVPNLLSGTDGLRIADAYGDSILKALDETMMPGLLEHVTERFHMTPLDFKHRYLSVHGAGFSIAPILR